MEKRWFLSFLQEMAGTEGVLEEPPERGRPGVEVRTSTGSWPLFFRGGRNEDGCIAILSGVWWLLKSQDSQDGSEQGLLRPGQGDI